MAEWLEYPDNWDRLSAHFGDEFGKTSKLYQGLSKPEASVLVQLRSGKVGLADYLKKIRAVDSALCNCEQSNETVAHILGECPEYDALRQKHLNQKKIWDVSALLSDIKGVRKAVQFMLSTELLEQFN